MQKKKKKIPNTSGLITKTLKMLKLLKQKASYLILMV